MPWQNGGTDGAGVGGGGVGGGAYLQRPSVMPGGTFGRQFNAPEYPGSRLGELTGHAFRGMDPAAYLHGPLGEVGADSRSPSAINAQSDYPGQGAAGSNEPRPSAPTQMAGGIESQTGGNFFRTGGGPEIAPGSGMQTKPFRPRAPGAMPPVGMPGAKMPMPPTTSGRGSPGLAPGGGLAGPLPPLPGNAPPPTSGRQYPGGNPNFDENTGTYRTPLPGNAPAPVVPPGVAAPVLAPATQHALTQAPPGGAPVAAAEELQGQDQSPISAPGTPTTTQPGVQQRSSSANSDQLFTQYLTNKPWTNDTRSFGEMFGSRPAMWSQWNETQQNHFRARHYRDPSAPPANDTPGDVPGQAPPLPDGTSHVDPIVNHDDNPNNDIPVSDLGSETTYGDVYDWVHGTAPPGGNSYWGRGADGKNAPDFPPYEYDPQTGSGAFTTDGKPLLITSSYIPTEDVMRIPTGKTGYRAVSRLLNSAQSAAATLIEAENEKDLDRRGDMIAKASAELQRHTAGLERYGIFYRPFSDQNALHPNQDPYAPLPENYQSGLVVDRGLKASFADMNKAGVPPEAMGSILELMQSRQQQEMSLANKARAFKLGQENLQQLKDDPARAKYAQVAGDIADNPDPMGAAGNELLRGHLVEKADQDLLGADQAMSQQAAARGLDPLTFAGKSYQGRLENRRGLRNDLAQQEVEASLRKRTGQQDSLNALRGVLQNTGAEQASRSDLQRLLMDQGLLGQNAYAGLGDYSTGYQGFKLAKENGSIAQQLAGAQQNSGMYQAGGAVAGALLAALI